MSLLKPEAPIVPPVEDNQEMVASLPDEAISPSSTKSINDLPPELLTIVLEFVTLSANRKTILDYRLVNSQWKDIVDSLVEKMIVAGQFPAFPTMNTMTIDSHGDVRVFLKCLLDRTPFPFNSLHLEETRDSHTEPSHLSMTSLPAFATNVGGTLTTLSLRDQIFPIKTLIAMLGPMQNVKRLRFEIVSIKEPDDVLPNPPFLPCLTTIEVLSNSRSRGDRADILYVWIIASYANQLEHLDIETYEPFPPLQARHEYKRSLPSGESFYIATTSESAFGNLKELKMFNLTREFLVLSKTPALRWLSLEHSRSEQEAIPFHLEDFMTFIENCSRTLETLMVDIWWDNLFSRELTDNYFEGVQPQISVPKLKTLTIHYPDEILIEIALSNFLHKFPALRKLQLIRFKPHYWDDEDGHQNVSAEAAEFGNEKNQDEVNALKERLAPLFQETCKTKETFRVAHVALKRFVQGAAFRHGEEDEDAAQMLELQAEIREHNRAFELAKYEIRRILKRLSALGENMDEVMVQQLLERGGFWSTCPSLRIVSAGNSETPGGNIFLARPGDHA